jgi:hypothetical protein
MARAVRRLSRSLRRDERGFTLVEAITALMLFVFLGTALAGLLTSAVSANSYARQKTIAEQIANDQVEWIRSQTYDNIGEVSGNPPGIVKPSGLKNVSGTVTVRGLTAVVATDISYVNDPTPTSYATSANYKKVVVTVTRNSDSKQLAQSVTYVAPPARAPYGGLNYGIINATVVDSGNTTPTNQVSGVTVGISSTNPSASRSDTTDSTGTASFAALTANPTSSDYYNVSITPPSGWEVLTEDDITKTPSSTSAQVSLAPGQTFTTLLHVYRPATIYVNLKNSTDNSTYTGNATVTVSSTRGSQTFAYTGSTLTIQTINGEKVVPGLSYTVSTSSGFASTAVTQLVPNNYPTDLTSNFTVLGLATGTVQATVTWGGTPVQNAQVTVTGGPNSVSLGPTATDAAGIATFTDVPSGSGYTVTATKSGQSASNNTVTVNPGATTNVPLSLPMGTFTLNATWGVAGPAAPGANITLTGGPMSVNVGPTATNGSGQVVFNAPVGSGYAVTGAAGAQSLNLASQSVTGSATWAIPVGSILATVKWGSAAGPVVAGASVQLLGPNGYSQTLSPTNASGQVTFSNVPAGSGYTLVATKSGQSTSPSVAATVTSGSTTNSTVTIGSMKNFVITVKKGGVNLASGTAVTVSITGGPIGTVGANPAFGGALSVNASSQVTVSVPQGTGAFTYTIKVYLTACGGATNRSGSLAGVSDNAATTNVTVNMTTATCPFSPLP